MGISPKFVLKSPIDHNQSFRSSGWVPNRQRAIMRTKDGLVSRLIHASLGLGEWISRITGALNYFFSIKYWILLILYQLPTNLKSNISKTEKTAISPQSSSLSDPPKAPKPIRFKLLRGLGWFCYHLLNKSGPVDAFSVATSKTRWQLRTASLVCFDIDKELP